MLRKIYMVVIALFLAQSFQELLAQSAPTATTATDITTTSFTANWTAVSGANIYLLDVSTSAVFSSYVGGYQNTPVSTTSRNITGLVSGGSYYYRLRVVTSAGTSGYSNTMSLALAGPPSAPTSVDASNWTTNTFTATWSPVGGATEYKIDVSTNNYSTFVGIYNNLSVSGTSIVISGLSTATTYNFRVRTVNPWGTSSSKTASTVTLTAVPVATAATAVNPGSFTANWNSVSGTTRYRLDVSSKSDFSDIIPAYNNLLVSGATSIAVTNLATKPVYFYRVRAENSINLPSASSNTIYAVNSDRNYVRSIDVTVAGKTDLTLVENATLNERMTNYAFVDGLGRPLQNVTVKGSPSQKDIIQPFAFDDYQREIKKYLPYTDGTNGWFKIDALKQVDAQGAELNQYRTGKQYLFYQGGGLIPVDQYPYAETRLESSPLSRVLEQGAMGEAWQPDASNSYSSTDRTVKNSYELNGSTEVIDWRYVVPGQNSVYSMGIVDGGTAASPRYYAANQLKRTRQKDEHHNEVIEYLDKDGRTILKRVQAVAGAVPVDNTNYASTYYVYDHFGNLVCVLPPMATQKLSAEYFHASATHATKESFLKRWAFRYKYDKQNRMTHKQVPGAGHVAMVYDVYDRLVLTQDSLQRAASPKNWSFTKYDQMNRPIASGIRDTTATLSQPAMQGVVDAFYAKPGARSGEVFIGAGGIHGYSNYTYPIYTGTTIDASKYLSVTYYDNYDFRSLWTDNDYSYVNDGLSQVVNGVTYSQPITASTSVNGMNTGTKVKVLDGGVSAGLTWLKSINYYDDRARLVQSQADNYKGGTDRLSTLNDFSGKILTTVLHHNERELSWRDVVGIEQDLNVIKRNSASTAGAASVEILPAGQDGWIEATFNTSGETRYFGLNDSNPDVNATNIDFAFRFVTANTVNIYENTTLTQTISDAKSGDVFRIQRNGTTVKFLRNGTLLRNASVTSTTALMADLSFATNLGKLVGMRASFASDTRTIARRFVYDHAGRLLETWHKIDAFDEILLVRNEYNELGQLVDKKLHSTIAGGGNAKQSVDYRYNIRGWLTSMNNSSLTNNALNDDTGDLFGMELAYNNVISGLSNAVMYNGNISAIRWSNNLGLGSTKELAYNYTYDPMNRLKGGSHKQLTTGTWGDGEYFEDGFSYDLNGNILLLNRKGKGGVTIDQLSYNYGVTTGQSNKLLGITDSAPAASKAEGFFDGNPSGTDYRYDGNGSVINDLNRGIGNTTSDGTNIIKYNFLNLPEAVTKGNNTIRYVYDANGRKLCQQVQFGSVTTRTDYVGELNYENDVLQFISHEEGRIVMASEKLMYTNPCETFTDFLTLASTLANFSADGHDYIKVTADGTTARTGISTIGSALNVNPGERYLLRVKGYRERGTAASSSAVHLQVKVGGTDTGWPGAVLPLKTTAATESWVEQVVTIPAGSPTTLTLGVAWNTVLQGEIFYLNEVEIIRLDTQLPEYQYFLKDHLGNIRVTFTTIDKVESSLATMETANRNAEAGQFVRYDRVRMVNNQAIFDHTNNPNGGAAIRLSGVDNEKTGLVKTLAVMPGDVVQMEVYAKYVDTNPNNVAQSLKDLISQVSTGATGVVTDGGSYPSNASSPFPFIGVNNTGSSVGTGPKAYLNYIMFDKDFNPIVTDPSQTNYVRMTTVGRETGTTNLPNGVAHELLTATVTVKQTGYMYIYLSNEEATPVEVYFDDFNVAHTKSPVVQIEDYYPYGLNYNSFNRENTPSNVFKYNGKELQDELNLGWLDYGARMYIPEIGRWLTKDALAEAAFDWTPYRYSFNNPIKYIDPDGLWEVSIDDGKLQFRAQKDDNLESFAKQTGLDISVLNESYKDLEISEGGLYGFGEISEIKVINEVLSSSDLEFMNCSNVAMRANGEQQDNAWANGGDGVDQMQSTSNALDTRYENVKESESKTGDVVTFNYKKDVVRKYVTETYKGSDVNNEVNRQYQGATEQPAHYGVVVLKTKDGQYVQTVLEKPGRTEARLSPMQPYNSKVFEPAPKTGGQFITYTKQ